MTQTPYILWAVLATGGAVAVYILMRRQNRALDRQGYGQFAKHARSVQLARRQAA